MLWVILIGFMILGWAVSSQLKSRFKKYSKTLISSGLSGREIAERMLNDHGIYDVDVISVPGKLTDHYNPAKKTVNLSPDVFNGRHVAAAAVAAHECGHAVQHAKAYSWLSLRSKLVPMVNVSSQIMNFVFIVGMLGAFAFSMFPFEWVIMVIIASQAVITAFTLVTLPVEYDASNRALAWLKTSGLSTGQEMNQAQDALKWAARTYLVAALAALTQLAYWVMVLMGSRD